MNRADLLRYFADRHHHEQAFFWQRFAPFLALNTAAFGFLALANTNLAHPKLMASGASVLAAFWCWIQWKSLEYVDLAKEPYFAYLHQLGIPWHHEPQAADGADDAVLDLEKVTTLDLRTLPPVMLRDRLTLFVLNPVNSTRAAVWASLGVFAFWMLWLLKI